MILNQYATDTVVMWLSNDQGLYSEVADAWGPNGCDGDEYIFGIILKDIVDARLFNGCTDHFLADIAREAFCQVNWAYVADQMKAIV